MRKGKDIFVKNAVKLRRSETEVAEAMQIYIATIAKEAKRNPAFAQEKARKVLRRTGVSTSKGKLKTTIVSWE